MRHGWASTQVPAAGTLAAVSVSCSFPGSLQDRNVVDPPEDPWASCGIARGASAPAAGSATPLP